MNTPADIDQAPGSPRDPKERIVALGEPADPVAVVTAEVLGGGVVTIDLSADGTEQEVVVLAARGPASALDASQIADGDDVGTTGVFVPCAGGRSLTLQR